MISRPLYLQKIKPFINKPLIKVITGMRRSGKSTFLKLLIKHLIENGVPNENIIYINKDLIEFDAIKTYTDLYKYFKNKTADLQGKVYFFIDEVQEILEWEKTLNSLLAEENSDLYISGSNSHLLSSELATLLTGRYIEIPLYTLSFKEFLHFRQKDSGSADIDDEFQLFLRYGGLPGIHFLQLTDEVVFQYIQSVVSTILLKDVVSKHQIRDISLLERIGTFLFDNCGNIVSAKKIADYLKSQNIRIGVTTVQNYIYYYEECFMLYKCQRYDIKGKRYLEFFEKYYLADSGIRHSILHYKENDISQLLENIIYLELLRRGYSVSIGKLDKLEVDFIATKNQSKIYIQVAYLLASEDTVEREFKPLEQIKDNYPKYVLTMDRIWGNDRSGIKRINIINFLLKELE